MYCCTFHNCKTWVFFLNSVSGTIQCSDMQKTKQNKKQNSPPRIILTVLWKACTIQKKKNTTNHETLDYNTSPPQEKHKTATAMLVLIGNSFSGFRTVFSLKRILLLVKHFTQQNTTLTRNWIVAAIRKNYNWATDFRGVSFRASGGIQIWHFWK